MNKFEIWKRFGNSENIWKSEKKLEIWLKFGNWEKIWKTLEIWKKKIGKTNNLDLNIEN